MDGGPITYRRRRGLAARGEREWRVDADALVMSKRGGGEKRLAWKDVIGVRLYHEALRRRPWRYAFELHTRQGSRVVIDNAHFAGRGGYEQRSESYGNLVRAALERITAANPSARALIGETQRRYFFLMLAALLAIGVLAYALIAIPTPLDHLPMASPLKLLLVFLLLPLFWFGVLRSMPRGVPLSEVPARCFPPDDGQS